MDLPMPMRFRHLKKTSKEAVGVYRYGYCSGKHYRKLNRRYQNGVGHLLE